MTIRLSRYNKTEALAIISTLLERIMFPFSKPNDTAAIMAHMDFLRGLESFDTTCQIQTFPDTQTTRITIDIVPSTMPKGLVKQ
jgi:hypothetical protein